MKKLLIIVLAICSANVSFAQTEKGKVLLGGSLYISNGRSTTNSNSTISANDITSTRSSFSLQINPNFGYFLADNFVMGVTLNSGFSNQIYATNSITGSNYTRKIFQTGGGGFIRLYGNIGEKIKFFAHGKGEYLRENNNYSSASTNTPSNTSNNNIDLEISPGFVYFLSPKIGLETMYGRIFFNKSFSNTTTNDINSINSGISLSPASIRIGINFYL